MPGVALAAVRRSYGSLPVLRDVDLSVRDGEVLAILGPSGCGKTTLLRVVAGLDPVDGGIVSIGDRVVSGPGVHVDAAARGVGLVFQDGALFPHLDVDGNVTFGLDRGARGARRSDTASTWLDLVGLGGLGGRRVDQLSGGQRQRVALARALAPEPSLLLLDEPYSNLDAALRRRLRAEVRQLLRTAAVTTVLVTHDRSEAFALADRVAVMIDGRIEQVGGVADLLDRPSSREVAEVVGDPQYLPGRRVGASVETELGTAACDAGDDGEVDVLLWPDRLTITPVAGGESVESGAGGVPARVVAVAHEGATVAVTVAVPGGAELLVRSLRPTDAPAIGDDDVVTLRLRGSAFPVYPPA